MSYFPAWFICLSRVERGASFGAILRLALINGMFGARLVADFLLFSFVLFRNDFLVLLDLPRLDSDEIPKGGPSSDDSGVVMVVSSPLSVEMLVGVLKEFLLIIQIL